MYIYIYKKYKCMCMIVLQSFFYICRETHTCIYATLAATQKSPSYADYLGPARRSPREPAESGLLLSHTQMPTSHTEKPKWAHRARAPSCLIHRYFSLRHRAMCNAYNSLSDTERYLSQTQTSLSDVDICLRHNCLFEKHKPHTTQCFALQQL